jgi:hypothetical protein
MKSDCLRKGKRKWESMTDRLEEGGTWWIEREGEKGNGKKGERKDTKSVLVKERKIEKGELYK